MLGGRKEGRLMTEGNEKGRKEDDEGRKEADEGWLVGSSSLGFLTSEGRALCLYIFQYFSTQYSANRNISVHNIFIQ